MKKITTTLITAFILLSLTGMAQTKVSKDADGNYHVTIRKPDTSDNKATGKTFTDIKGNVYPLYISQRGKLFVLKTSKAGRVYKSYIKED